ncbi:MAG TPA: YlxR family protein [Dehalococcoidales bacterium]|nr:YlxR family protein [Dehalococcoidales bacterium]
MASSSRSYPEQRNSLTRRKKIRSQPALSKHVPQRTCLACRQVKPQRELIRLVRAQDGNIEIDASGKKAGRGAYLCQTWECWEVGLKGKRLEHALRGQLTPGNQDQLIKNARDLVKGDN